MSETRTLWMTELGVKYPQSATLSILRTHTHTVPVIVTPIEDESLPHPGDGKEWETRAGKWKGMALTALCPPDERGYLMVRVVEDDPAWAGHRFIAHAPSLRERKPEPEHGVGRKPSEHMDWCPRSKPCTPGHCTCIEECECERRSGEERRKEVRRGYDAPGGYGQERDGLIGRLSGRDRRKP